MRKSLPTSTGSTILTTGSLSVNKGVTLIELLVVVTIIVVLATLVWIYINPLELKKEANDSRRLADLSSLQQAIAAAQTEQTGTKLLCSGSDYPCGGNSHSSDSDRAKSSGLGWVKVNLQNQKNISIPVLPLDPLNTDEFHYRYCANIVNGIEVWELDTVLESTKYKTKMLDVSDGGNEDRYYEIGTELSLIAPINQGTCVYN